MENINKYVHDHCSIRLWVFLVRPELFVQLHLIQFVMTRCCWSFQLRLWLVHCEVCLHSFAPFPTLIELYALLQSLVHASFRAVKKKIQYSIIQFNQKSFKIRQNIIYLKFSMFKWMTLFFYIKVFRKIKIY